MNNEKLQKIINSSDFLDFVNREFDKTITYATIDELAEFALGGIEEAIESYVEMKGIRLWNSMKLWLNL